MVNPKRRNRLILLLLYLPLEKKKTLEKKPRKKEEANWVGFIGLAYQRQEGYCV